MKDASKYLQSVINNMSLDEKIGGLLTLGFAGTKPRKHIYEFITKYHCGGLRLSPTARLFGNYVSPTGEVIVDIASNHYLKSSQQPVVDGGEYKKTIMELQTLAKSRKSGVPLHFSYDQEGGTSADFNFGGVSLFPKPMGLTATNDKNLCRKVAIAMSEQSLAVGFNYLHSPVLDVNTDPKNPEIYTRAYSDDVNTVIEYARETCIGLKEAGMIATGKHFPGRGDSDVDAHYELPVIDVEYETMINRELLPYKVLIAEDLLPSIMIAHSIYPAFDNENVATVSHKIVTGLLREKLGFKGVITTDSMTMGALALRYGVANACAMSLVAGCDLILMKAENSLVEETINKIKTFIYDGKLSVEDIEEKLLRILKMKYEYGMFTTSKYNDVDVNKLINKSEYKVLASDVGRKSIMDISESPIKTPIDVTKKTLVIEQMNKGVPNNSHWHYGYLYHKSLEYGLNADYYEIDYVIDQEDIDTIITLSSKYDRIIVTNFYVRSKSANNDFMLELQEKFAGDLLIITNTPYKLSTLDEMKHVILTFATTPPNIDSVCNYLFKGVEPLGQWPLVHYPTKEG